MLKGHGALMAPSATLAHQGASQAFVGWLRCATLRHRRARGMGRAQAHLPAAAARAPAPPLFRRGCLGAKPRRARPRDTSNALPPGLVRCALGWKGWQRRKGKEKLGAGRATRFRHLGTLASTSGYRLWPTALPIAHQAISGVNADELSLVSNYSVPPHHAAAQPERLAHAAQPGGHLVRTPDVKPRDGASPSSSCSAASPPTLAGGAPRLRTALDAQRLGARRFCHR